MTALRIHVPPPSACKTRLDHRAARAFVIKRRPPGAVDKPASPTAFKASPAAARCPPRRCAPGLDNATRFSAILDDCDTINPLPARRQYRP